MHSFCKKKLLLLFNVYKASKKIFTLLQIWKSEIKYHIFYIWKSTKQFLFLLRHKLTEHFTHFICVFIVHIGCLHLNLSLTTTGQWPVLSRRTVGTGTGVVTWGTSGVSESLDESDWPAIHRNCLVPPVVLIKTYLKA